MENLRNKAYQTLRRSESFLKTDMVYVSKGSFWSTLNFILGILSSFILVISFAHFVPKDVYGNYKYILSIAGILTSITLTGMNASITRAVAQGNEGTFKKSLIYQLKWNLIFLAIAAVIGGYYLWQKNLLIGLSVIIMGIFSPVLNSVNTYIAFLNGKKDFRRITQYSFLTNIISVLVMILTMIVTSNVIWLVLAFIGTSTITNTFFCWRTFQIYQPNSQIDPHAITYGTHLSIMNILTGIADRIDSVLLFHFLGSSQLANYSFAAAPPEQLKGLFKQIGPLTMPKFAERKLSDIKKTIWHKMLIIFLIALVIAVVYMIAAPWIFSTFFPNYISVVNLSRIYALILPLYFSQPISAALQAHRKTKILYLTNNATAIIWISSVFIGIYFWGIIGVIVAQIVWRAASALIGITTFYKIKD